MANRDFTTRRSAICNAYVEKLLEVNGTGKFRTTVASAEPRLKFWDEVTDFPAVHVNSGGETREYLGQGDKFRFLALTFRCYVNEEDAVQALEELMEDVETVIEDNNPLTYTTGLGVSTTTIQTTINSIDTDEGVMEPFGIGEIICTVQY